MPGVDKKWLEAKIKEWQKILRLQDWDIRLCDEPLEDMDKDSDTICGMCKTRPAIKEADIFIHLDNLARLNYDVEQTLVHELLHIQQDYIWRITDMAPHPRAYKDFINQVLEACHDQLSKTLVSLYRGYHLADALAVTKKLKARPRKAKR